MHQKFVLSPLLCAVVVHIVSKLAREGVLSELLYVADLVMMRETTEGLR